METSETKAADVPVAEDWTRLKSAFPQASEDLLETFTFLGCMICHSGERIYIYRDNVSQRRIYLDQSGNFHCGSCIS